MPILNFSCSLSLPLLFQVNLTPSTNKEFRWTLWCILWRSSISHAFTIRVQQVSSSSSALSQEEFEIVWEELLLLTSSISNLDRHTNFLDLPLSNCSFNFLVPTGSLVLDPHKHSVSCTGELGLSGQRTRKLPHRPRICAGQRFGNTGERVCVYIQEKSKGEKQQVSHIPMKNYWASARHLPENVY